MNMERRLLGKRINQIRKERGLTSEALSEICDVNAGHIRQIESGIRLQVCLCLSEYVRH